MKKELKRILSLALAGLTCLFCLAGCENGEPASSVAEPYTAKNGGQSAALVLGAVGLSPERQAVLREIADKYQADFPNTVLEVRSFESDQALKEALADGTADIAEVTDSQQLPYVQEGLLLDIRPYLEGWEESDSLTSAAKSVLSSMGSSHAYLLLNAMEQPVLYCRTDWFKAYNDTVAVPDRALYETWEQIISAAGKMGDRGRFAFGGGGSRWLLGCFDSMLWGALPAEMADPGAAYLLADGEDAAVFTLPEAAEAVDQFTRFITQAALPDALHWDTQQAVEAFAREEAGLLLADRAAGELLKTALPENTWTAQPLPKGLKGSAFFTPDSYTGWGISARTAHWETAFHFLSFLSNADNNTHYAKVCGVLPIHQEAESLEASLAAGALAVEMDMVQKGSQFQYAFEPSMYRAFADWQPQAAEKLKTLASGKLSQEELLQWMNGYWSQAVSEEGRLF